ncbi:translocation/assembly module TamB domain-containing protein [Sphingomonas donggukensis]|uniref:Translocation/assembly module TamB domain-containing protein n=1 Tax=Sphingomonas donggukensis TaxID=2949093 RepID=A0ABY4U010_9SPHN|nr:translocation/assembly module TamB domain-containing protein [Sphingomonas donggukensis]URW76714.1 translocation/assembly module TamB domain-containing protein [Sphingomonas donggukensis]
MAEEQVVVVERRPVWQTVVKWVGIVLAALVLLAIVVVLGINTQPGRRFVADRLSAYTLANGLNVRVGRIEGSIYGAMVLRDVRVQDQKGTFLMSPELRVDWRPFAFARNHVDVRSLTSPLVSMSRTPELKATPTDPNAPTLPDIDIDVNRFAIDRIDLAPAVSGARRLARVQGSAHIADARAQVVLNGATLTAPGIAGGDRVALTLDAVPDRDRLDLDLKLNSPANGLVAGMAGLKAPLTLSVDGRGGWSSWTGRAISTLGGGQLANLAISAKNGNFQIRGTTQPGLYLQGPVERLTAPRLDVAIDAALAERIVDAKVQLRSAALQVSGDGKIDLAQSRFDDFRVEGVLLTPGSIAPNLNGRSVRTALALDGAFATPVVDYKLQAAALGFGEIVAQGVYAEGRAQIDADRIMVPITARATRISGLNAAAGGLLTNVSIKGDLAIDGGTEILSDNLRLRSDKIDATAIIAANLATGRYAGALKGRINDYRIDSFGIVNLTTDASLYTAPAGGFGIRGRVVAQTSRIFNTGARDFLGGNAIARVDLNYTPQGIILFNNVRVTAPQFRVLRGSGRYDPAGPLLVDADAYSTQYGPISARVTGTLTAPVAVVRAARPGLGVGLVDVVATIRGRGDSYAIVARGGSEYGPFSADLLLRPGAPLTADIRTARFAGIDFNGRIQQTPAGPFAGRLRFAGSGVSGTLSLASQGGYQRADVDARASNAVIPGTAGLTIGRAIIVGTAVLYPNQPTVTGDAQIANLKMGEFLLRTARAKVDYRGGNGTAQAFAEGSSGVPFRIGANARFSPRLWVAALQGTASGINFRTASPARIEPGRDGYRLLPTRVDFDQGSVRLAGLYGRTTSLQARLDRLDLAIANAFVPGLGIGGNATGSVDYSQAGNAFPAARMKLDIANFTRSSLASVSTPVNVQMAGALEASGGDLRALVKRGTTTVGRMVASLRPVGAGAGSWVSRITAAPLSGGIRYNGPAGVLFSLGGFAGQQLSGPIGVAADFGGRVSAPQLTGIVRASNLTYENEIYGTRLTNMRVNGRFTNDRFELTELNARAGEGTVAAQGTVGLSSVAGFPIDVRATLNDARLARSDALGATATGTIRVTNSAANGGLIQGELILPEVRYEVIRQGAAEVPELTGVRRKSDAARATAAQQAARASPPGLFKLDLRLRADNRLFVSGMGLESEWLADIRVGGTSAAPQVTGQARVVRGTYSFAGKRFDLSRGIVRFEGGPLGNPALDIAATTTTEGITATITIAGNALSPRLSFTSSPNLPQDEVLSRLLFGSSVTNLSATEAIQLAAALNSLRGSGGGGLNPLGKLRSVTGIDRLRILGADEATGRGTALSAGQYLTDDIYIEIITDSKGFTATQLEIALTKALSLLSSTGSFGGSNATLRYSKDY